MTGRWSLRGALALGVAILAAPATAATPEAAAAKQLAAADRAVRAAYRAALTAAQIPLSAAIANVELALLSVPTPDAPGDLLFAALASYQATVFAAGNAAASAHADAARAALATLGTGFLGRYPAAFYPGDGTPTARLETALAKDAERAYAKVRKRLAKLAARFAAEGFALDFVIRPPLTLDSHLWSESVVNVNPVLPPTIDLAVAFSVQDVADDAQIRMGGTGSVVTAPVDLGPILVFALAQPDSPVLVDDGATPEDDRWSTSFGGQPFREGVYILSATQTTVPGDDVTLGVR
jgi:hypothetical protein